VSNYAELPEGLQGGMQRYVEDGIQAGHFLTAVLSNNLLGAVSRADGTNIKLIPEIVRWIYNEAPSGCWGSAEKVQAWQGTTKEFTGGRI
tara:strand:- start:217 stop:486 length:270 start_codon:yes stop_codon:yes gene_type:complete